MAYGPTSGLGLRGWTSPAPHWNEMEWNGANGARCAWAMAVHHAVGISRRRNSGYRPSRANIVAQGLSTQDPSLSPTHLSIRRGRTTTTHYTHHQVSLMVSRNTTLVPFPGVAHWASLWGRPQRWHAKGACVIPNNDERKKERKKEKTLKCTPGPNRSTSINFVYV